MKQLFRMMWVLVVTSGLALGAVAQERGSKDQAKALTMAAVEHIKKAGPEKAYADFTNDKATWTKADLYVMVFDAKNFALAHGANPKLVGKDMSEVKDANGVPIIPGLNSTADKGGGWFDYEWPDPLTKKIMPKSTYALKNPAGGGFVGVGIYR